MEALELNCIYVSALKISNLQTVDNSMYILCYFSFELENTDGF